MSHQFLCPHLIFKLEAKVPRLFPVSRESRRRNNHCLYPRSRTATSQMSKPTFGQIPSSLGAPTSLSRDSLRHFAHFPVTAAVTSLRSYPFEEQQRNQCSSETSFPQITLRVRLFTSSTTSLFPLTGLQEQKVNTAVQVSLPGLPDFVEGVEKLHHMSSAIQEHEHRTFAQQVGKTLRSLTNPNQTSYSIPTQTIPGENLQQSQPAESKAIFTLPNTLKKGEWTEIPSQQSYTKSHVSTIYH